jgi:hypothetical protein
MSIQKLPSGRYRAQVYDPTTGKNVSVSKVLGTEGTFRTKAEAKRAREKARERLEANNGHSALTLADFYERWTTDPLFARPKESTNLHNAERTRAFAKRYGTVPIRELGAARGDGIVAEWLEGGKRNSTVPALRAMLTMLPRPGLEGSSTVTRSPSSASPRPRATRACSRRRRTRWRRSSPTPAS